MLILVDARVYRYEPPSGRYYRHDALAVDGDRIVGLDERDVGAGVERVSLNGATVLPAFSDCHVHVTDTGYFLGARDLNPTRSYDDYARAIGRVPLEHGVVLAGQYDESFWRDGRVADASPLNRLHPDARAMVVRVDGHSCVVNRATLAWLALSAEISGIELDGDGVPTGKLFLEANWRAQAAFMEAVPQAAKREAERRAVDVALSHGALHLHAQLVGFKREEYAVEIAALRTLAGKWYPKICEPDPQLAAELGLPYVGGDVFLDGSIGSCTAAVGEPFLSGVGDTTSGNGALRFSDDQVYAYFATAEAMGISAGVHAIGDRAIEQCLATWERVLDGKPSRRGTRHFIEHFEIARPEHIEACARMGIYLSMQPQFDLLWGGAGNMYDVRLGTARMQTMNALGRAQRAGAILCGGDDSPVCNLDPLQGMQACVAHHEPSERLSAEEALTMYTYNAALLAHAERETGILAPGFAADLVVLDGDPLDGAAFSDCTVLQTWCDGVPAYSSQ
ncbi:MAG TPA: amidohydrolase family protein [Verrucomicrobiae bacterium]|jgi:predicted amidohydrolase YtcJ|nr:amidohydrolase family protein [Verrucomicrobiae bacterium]